MMYANLYLSAFCCVALLCPFAVMSIDVEYVCSQRAVAKIPMIGKLSVCCLTILKCHCYLSICRTQPDLDGCANQKTYNTNCDDYKTRCADVIGDFANKCLNLTVDILDDTSNPSGQPPVPTVPRNFNVTTTGPLSSHSMTPLFIVLAVLLILTLLALALWCWCHFGRSKEKSDKQKSSKKKSSTKVSLKASKDSFAPKRKQSERSLSHRISTQQLISPRAGSSHQLKVKRSRNSLKNSGRESIRKRMTSAGSLRRARSVSPPVQQVKMSTKNSTSKGVSFDSRAVTTQAFSKPRRASSKRIARATTHEASHIRKMFA